MLRAMIDSMVFDRIADDPAAKADLRLAASHRVVKLYSTPVQEAQIAAIPDPQRRKDLRDIEREAVPTADPGVDVSLLPRHQADELILEAAKARCDVLVTDDKRLTARASELSVTAWPTDRLLRWARDHADAQRR